MQRKDGVKARGEDSYLPAKEDLRLPEARRKTRNSSLSQPQKEQTLPMPWIQTPMRQYIWWLSHPACDTLLQQSQYSTLLEPHYLKLHCLYLLCSPEYFLLSNISDSLQPHGL